MKTKIFLTKGMLLLAVLTFMSNEIVSKNRAKFGSFNKIFPLIFSKIRLTSGIM